MESTSRSFVSYLRVIAKGTSSSFSISEIRLIRLTLRHQKTRHFRQPGYLHGRSSKVEFLSPVCGLRLRGWPGSLEPCPSVFVSCCLEACRGCDQMKCYEYMATILFKLNLDFRSVWYPKPGRQRLRSEASGGRGRKLGMTKATAEWLASRWHRKRNTRPMLQPRSFLYREHVLLLDDQLIGFRGSGRDTQYFSLDANAPTPHPWQLRMLAYSS